MSKMALQINAFVLSITPVIEKNSLEGSSSKKAIGFLYQQKCRHASVLSLSPDVEKIVKRAASVRKY